LYYRYIVSDRQNLEYLINIFNHGGFRLNQVYSKFLIWVEHYSKFYNHATAINILKQDKKFTLNDAWLSGFIDAEGCFSAFQKPGRNTYRMRFILKQKNEYDTFIQIKMLWSPIKIDLLQHKDIVVLSMETLISLRKLNSYLSTYPLHSNKNIAYNKWLKLFRVVEDGGRGKSFEQIQQMAQGINKLGEEDKVHLR
jgi:hypothetical protein